MKHSTRSTSVTASVLLSVCILAFALTCYADFATPYVELNNKLGDVSTAHAYVITVGPQSTTRFMVIVTTDTMEHVVLQATAKEGIVKDSLLGREVLVKAAIAKASSGKTPPELEILHVEALPSASPSEPGKKL